MVDPNPNPEANQLPEAASLPDGFVESSSAEAVVDYKEEILLEPGSRPEVVIEDGGGSSLGKLVEHVVDHSESTAAADAGPAHGEGNAKGKSVEGAQTHAITSEEIAVAGSAENKKKETPEVKRKSVKRAFKSEKEFLEFTLKYQQVLTERDSAIAVRDKLESLCRELQRQNKLLMDECKRVSTEGQHLRLDLSNKFQDAIKEVSNKLEEQKDECISQLKENEIDSDDDELMQLLMDDTDELMMLEILKEEHMLLELAQRPHSRRYVHWDREGAHTRLMKDYFDENPTWGPDVFRRRFRMRKELFTRIVNALGSHDEYFQWRVDAAGRKGLSPLQKCTVAIRQLAFGGPTDHYDEYLRVAETTTVHCLFNFCRCMSEVFGEYYLRKPNAVDCQRLIQMHEQRHGFPGMLGSLDCMHWDWKNCPIAWKGQFTCGDCGVPTIMLEVVASVDMWIWHAFFGVAGSKNGINVLNQSPLFFDVLQGQTPNVNFIINGTPYAQGYYLTDEIHPECAIFVKSFQCPQDPKRRMFKERHEAAKKDVERAFQVLQARWAMVRGPSRFSYKNYSKDIMIACIILHNMIIEDEGDTASDWADELNINESSNNNDPQIIQGPVTIFSDYLMRDSQLHDSDREKHHQLQADLIEHVWARYDNN